MIVASVIRSYNAQCLDPFCSIFSQKRFGATIVEEPFIVFITNTIFERLVYPNIHHLELPSVASRDAFNIASQTARV
jgi:hypothetical protein